MAISFGSDASNVRFTPKTGLIPTLIEIDLIRPENGRAKGSDRARLTIARANPSPAKVRAPKLMAVASSQIVGLNIDCRFPT